MTMQEKLVDGIIADYLETKFNGVKEKLSKTSKYFKRGAKASILGTDRKMYELIKTLEEKNESEEFLSYFDELVNAYREYVEVADTEVKTHGEVMTPIWLVEDMLNTLPSDVWTNPNLKWLDPCSGVGTYSSIVVQRLMKGLETFEENPIKRYRHIIEEMIYVCELQPKNMFIFQCVFDKDDTNELNTYCGSFLDEKFNKHMTDEWGVEKFDIVIGNPPYQTQKEGNTKTHPLWHLFVNKSLDILIDGGYLNMVHPDGWRNVDGMFKDTQNLLKNREVLYLEIHNKKDGIKTFGANTTYDFYCVRNKKNNGYKTQIKCVDGVIENVDLSKMEFIPNGRFSEFEKLIAKEGDEKIKVLNNSSYHTQRPHMSKNKVGEFIYPCDYTTSKDGSIILWYSNTNENEHFGIPKVIWSNGISTPCVDLEGEYGLTQFSYAIIDDKKNLDDIRKAMLSDKFLELMTYSDGVTGVGMHRYNRKAISTFRKDFYKQFLND
jgi:hypothetical protein